MPLATKNGSLIVKSGGLAETCSCCGSPVGACCTGSSCSITSQSECQGTGQTFRGVGTVCSPNPCCSCNSLIAVEVSLADILGGASLTGRGCSGRLTGSRTIVDWGCDSSGIFVRVISIYSTKMDGSCNFLYPIAGGISKAFDARVAVSNTGNCSGFVSGACVSGWPVETTLTRSSFSVGTDIGPPYDTIPDRCWEFGSPSGDPVFPKFIKIGPSSNPLP